MGVYWSDHKQRWVTLIKINEKKHRRYTQTQEEAEALLEELRRNPDNAPRNRAPSGSGSVYWSEYSQRWVAYIEIKGKAYKRKAKTQEEAQALLEELKRNPNAAPRKQAPNGSGSVSWNKSNQRWFASVKHNGKRHTRYAPTRELAELALIELRRELGLADADTIEVEPMNNASSLISMGIHEERGGWVAEVKVDGHVHSRFAETKQEADTRLTELCNELGVKRQEPQPTGEHDMATIEDVARRAALAAIEYHKKQTPLAIQQRIQIATLAIELRQAMAAKDWQAVERIAEAMEEAGAEV